jgi:class 3 adenylate cyclase
MTFKEVLAQVLEWLQHDQRLSYRAVKRQFSLTDDYFEDLKDALLYAYPQVSDDGRGLVWTGAPGTAPAGTAAPAVLPAQVPLAYTPLYLVEKILTSRRALEGERKQVTVLFADLKDSTELIRGLDPEAAQQLLDPALHRMMDAVHRFESTVNQVLGDGIMALFGAPIAHEDHALRACYAALAMQAAMRASTEDVRRTHGLELRMRVGLHSGEVVVRAIGNDLHMDYSAVGETTVLAARMEQTATPGSIRLTPATLRLVEGLVQVDALGPVPVKGLVEPVEVFELLGASGVRRRLQAAAPRGLTRFVGRDQELVIIQQALAQASTGHGQVVALVGEPGVGKSRLVYEFTHSHCTQAWRVLESASVSYGKATPYFPVIDLLRRYGHVDDGDDLRTIRAKVTGQVLTLDATLQALLPALLGDDAHLAPLKQLLIERTHGNPFFLEESVRTLVETGGLVGTRGSIGWRRPCQPSRCPPPCRPCWRRVLTGSRRRTNTCCRPPRSLAPRCLSPCSRPLPPSLRKGYSAASRTCRPPSFSTRRASSQSGNIPSSTPSPTKWPMEGCCRSGATPCTPASWRSWRRSPPSV